MPAFNSGDLEKILIASFVANGLVDKVTVDGVLIPTAVPTAESLKLIKAIAQGVSTYQKIWQATQTVSVPGVTSGTSVAIGELP